jgi:hypothetical protein
MTSLNRSSDTNYWLSRNPIALLSFSQCIKVEEEEYVGRRRTPWNRLLPYLGKLYSLDCLLQSWSTGASYRPGSHPPCRPFSHDPKNPLSHDLDPVMAALSAQIGPTLTFSSRLVPSCQNGCTTTPHTHLTCSSTPSITGCGETIHTRIHGDTHTRTLHA